MGMDINQKRLAAAVICGTLALCAVLLASGSTNILAASLLPVEAGGGAPAKSKTVSTSELPGTTPPDVIAILKRNIFDSSTGPLWPPAVTEPPIDPEAIPEQEFVVDPNAPPPPCEGPLRLVASVHSARFEEWSFATIGTGEGKPLLYRQGGQVNDNQILAIFPSAVFLKPSAGQPCSLALFQQDASQARDRSASKKARTRAAAKASSRTSKSSGFNKAELDANIKRVSDTEFTITRDLVDKVLQNQAALMRSARIVPHEVDGKVVGVKLYGIRRNSLLGKLGLRNGDLMRSINGYDMTSPDRALEAYSKLRSASTLTVAVQRRGANVNVSYRIQ